MHCGLPGQYVPAPPQPPESQRYWSEESELFNEGRLSFYCYITFPFPTHMWVLILSYPVPGGTN